MSKLIEKYPFLKGHEDIINFAIELKEKTGCTGFWLKDKSGWHTVGRPTKKKWRQK